MVQVAVRGLMIVNEIVKTLLDEIDVSDFKESEAYNIRKNGKSIKRRINDYIDIEPKENVEKVIYTIDELTGLISATALMRPSKSILDLEAKSVKKKFKQKSFAAGVNRDVIENGAKMLGKDLNEITAETIKGMQKVAEEIGLKGEL